jgi:agmatinase
MVNPLRDWATVVDCGDIANSPFDKITAIKELASGSSAILKQAPKNKDKSDHVRLITIGGDHTISEFMSELPPALREGF